MFVACKVPSGLIIDHLGQRITLNGPHTGVNILDMPRNGLEPDTLIRYHGWGITELTGQQADAFQDWYAATEKGHGPVSTGMVEMFDKRADAEKEVKSRGKQKSGFEGLDPDKDLPEGVETRDDKQAA